MSFSADVALMLAEAYYHSNQAAKAQEYLNMVRNRAGLSSVTPTGKALRDAIYTERWREFVYEFKAYSDMKRGYTKAEMLGLMKKDGATEYDNTDYYLPIPHTQHILTDSTRTLVTSPESINENRSPASIGAPVF